MKMMFMDGDKPSTLIVVDYPNNTVTIENYTDDLICRAFGINENPSIKDFEEFLEDRCLPRERHMLKFCLNEIGVDYYEPLEICKKTNGRLADDNMHIEFLDED